MQPTVYVFGLQTVGRFACRLVINLGIYVKWVTASEKLFYLLDQWSWIKSMPKIYCYMAGSIAAKKQFLFTILRRHSKKNQITEWLNILVILPPEPSRRWPYVEAHFWYHVVIYITFTLLMTYYLLLAHQVMF